jgi:hypothetical protein
MAPIVTTQNWLSVYHHIANDTSPPKIVFESEPSSLYATCEGYVRNDVKLLNLITVDPPCRTFILPSSRKGTVNILHSCSDDDERNDGPFIVGIHGVGFSSPWKEVRSPYVVKALDVPTSTRSAITVPSMKQMFEENDGVDFSNLVGDETGGEITSLAKMPSRYLLHPRLFLTCVDAASMRIDNLASKIIFETLNQQNDDDGYDNLVLEDQPGTKQVYKLLTYSWGSPGDWEKSRDGVRRNTRGDQTTVHGIRDRLESLPEVQEDG